MGEDNCKTKWESFKLWNSMRLILDILRYMRNYASLSYSGYWLISVGHWQDMVRVSVIMYMHLSFTENVRWSYAFSILSKSRTQTCLLLFLKAHRKCVWLNSYGIYSIATIENPLENEMKILTRFRSLGLNNYKSAYRMFLSILRRQLWKQQAVGSLWFTATYISFVYNAWS